MQTLLGQTIRPEIELLLCCARTSVDDERAGKIKYLVENNNIDWNYFIEIAVLHKVMPLVYTSLNSSVRDVVPQEVLDKLRSLFHANAQSNLFVTGELLKILASLEANAIKAVPYKGPVLANSVYGNLAMRHAGDLDIIVQLHDILKVKKILLDLGYQRKSNLTDAQERAFFQSKSEHTFDFVDDGKPTLIEIHWRITPRYSSIIEPKHFWKYLEPCAFAGKTVNSLPLDYWLPILCVHGSRHCWQRLAWLCDIAELIRIHPGIDWERTISFANELGCRRMLFLGLFLVSELMGVVLPDQVLQEIKTERKISTLASEVLTHLFDPSNAASKFMGETFYHIQARERFQDKAIYLQSFLDWFVHPAKWNWNGNS
jgi:hypothetical protein